MPMLGSGVPRWIRWAVPLGNLQSSRKTGNQQLMQFVSYLPEACVRCHGDTEEWLIWRLGRQHGGGDTELALNKENNFTLTPVPDCLDHRAFWIVGIAYARKSGHVCTTCVYQVTALSQKNMLGICVLEKQIHQHIITWGWVWKGRQGLDHNVRVMGWAWNMF